MPSFVSMNPVVMEKRVLKADFARYLFDIISHLMRACSFLLLKRIQMKEIQYIQEYFQQSLVGFA